MKRLQGFTILELMIVLGLLSLLLSSFFIASQNNISYSTYRDSIFDLQSFLSKQYSQVLNPKGLTDNDIICTFNSNLTISTGSANKGQSDCVILGRYIFTPDSSGHEIYSYPVFGKIIRTGLEDLALLKDSSRMKIDYYDGDLLDLKEKYTLTYSSTMKNSDNSANLRFSMLIVKSPTSGNIYSLISPESVLTVGALINSRLSTTNNLVICVDRGSLSLGSNMGVKVTANSSNPNGVSIVRDSPGECS